MHGCRISDDHLDRADIDAEAYRMAIFIGVHPTARDQLLSVEVPDLLPTQITLEHRERGCPFVRIECGSGPAVGLGDGGHVRVGCADDEPLSTRLFSDIGGLAA